MTRCQLLKSGFTLMEIMVVVILLSIVGSIASPMYNSHIATEDAFRFVQLLRAARYEALETQIFHRLIVISAEDRYIVQRYNPVGWAHVVTEPSLDSLNPANTNWVSILEDEEEVFFSPGVLFECGLNSFFMRPDGTIVGEPKFEAMPIPEVIATFSYANTAIAVDISSIGVTTSEGYND